MKLNIQIVAEDLSAFTPIRYCRTDRLIRTLEYPMLYTGEETLYENVLYVADSGMCPDLRHETACYSFLLAGKLNRDPVTMNCNLCVISENVTVTSLFNEVVKLFHHYQSWENELLTAISQELPLPALGKLSVPVLRHPLGLVDTDYRYVFYFGEKREGDAPYSSLAEPGDFMSLDDINAVRYNDDFIKAVDTSEIAWFYEEDLGCPCLYKNIRIYNRYCGRLIMDLPDHKVTDRDYALFDAFSEKIWMAMTLHDSTKLSDLRKLNDVIEELLDGRQPDEDKLVQSLEMAGWQKTDQYFCILTDTLSSDVSLHTTQSLAAGLSASFNENTWVIVQNQIFFLINLSVSGTSQEKLLDVIKPVLRDSMIKAGISGCFKNFQHLSSYYRQCQMVLSIGLKRHPTWWYFRFTDYIGDTILQCCADSIPPEAWSDEGIQRLMEHDRKRNGNLCSVLRVYLENNMSIVKTADLLYIHKNTLLYRLNSIKEILQTTLEDPEERYVLLTILKLLAR